MENLRLLVVAVFVAVVSGLGPNDIFMPPSVTMNEKELIVLPPMGTYTMVCRATGSPAPTITWYHNEAVVENNLARQTRRNGNMEIMMMGTLDGKYQCKAENVFGISQSNITELRMATIKNFQTQTTVQPTVVNEGDPLILKCLYEDPFSQPPASFSWVTQDAIGQSNTAQNPVSTKGRLAIDERGNLHFQYVLRTDNIEDHYHLCAAWNSVMSIKKFGSPYRIKVKPGVLTDSPPVLVHQSGNNGYVEVVEGETINLYCMFKGYPDVYVSWEKLTGKQPFFRYRPDIGHQNMYLENSERTEVFEGKYRCTGYQKDRATKATAEFTVKVLQKPKFIVGPVNVNVTEGGDVSFNCRVKAHPTASVEWLVNGVPLLPAGKVDFDMRRKFTVDSYTFSKLRRGQNQKTSDLQVVTCKAINYRADGTEVGRSYMDGYINVLKAMKFVTPPENHTISDSNQNVVLDCELSSDPSKKPRISWHREQAPIHLEKDKFELKPNGSLVIVVRNFDNLDKVKGEYMCVAETTAPADQAVAKAWVDVKEGVVPVAPIASASINLWWIGLILVLLILLLIFLLICCLIKRNTGESYPVDEVERKMGNDPEKDLMEMGFHDYQRKEKNPIGGSRASLDSSIKPLDSDDDSMLEYGDIDPGKFNEDGSFIGQYANYDRNKGDATV